MRTRSSFEICAPLGIFALACVLSFPTRILAIGWMTLGACCLGYRTIGDFPADGIPRRWLRGVRGACLFFYHLAWWPWYMRRELREFALRVRRVFVSGRLPRGTDASTGENRSRDEH